MECISRSFYTVKKYSEEIMSSFFRFTTPYVGKIRPIMKSNAIPFVTIVVIGLALMMPKNLALADSENMAPEGFGSFEKLSAEWQQWALSIPTSENPQLDTNGGKCMVGQRGPVWFLAGVFTGGAGMPTRICSVPEGKALYFPVINSVQINVPNVCGQGPQNFSVKELRAMAAPIIDGATNLSVTVDGIAIKNLRRVKSDVFEVALPEENVFDAPCGGPGSVPAGVFSPAVDDGFYVLLKPLPVGPHTLHFHAESLAFGLIQDVTYNLAVVKVSLK
jgi:hypothetical protein